MGLVMLQVPGFIMMFQNLKNILSYQEEVLRMLGLVQELKLKMIKKEPKTLLYGNSQKKMNHLGILLGEMVDQDGI